MRISDWSSDVCSSDLVAGVVGATEVVGERDALLAQRSQFGATLGDQGVLVDGWWRGHLVGHGFESIVWNAGAASDASFCEIGSASCRGRVCQYVEILVVAVSFKKKNTNKTIQT